jgi:anti-anti-sigma factor
MAGLTGDPTASAEILAESPRGEVTVRLRGEIDLSNAESLWPTIARAVERFPETLAFDLSEVGFMDSSGIALLLRTTHSVKTVQVRNASPMIRRVLELTGLEEIFRIVP